MFSLGAWQCYFSLSTELRRSVLIHVVMVVPSSGGRIPSFSDTIEDSAVARCRHRVAETIGHTAPLAWTD